MLLQNFDRFWPSWPVVLAQVGLAFASLIIYRRYFYSLNGVPGPFLASFTRLWHVMQIAAGNFNLQLAKLHERNGYFVRIAYNEVSVTHPDAIKQVLLAPLKKAPWYRIMAMPDYRFQNPFSILNPKAKKESSKYFASAYTTTNVLQSEGNMDRLLEKLKGYMDKYAEKEMPMSLGAYLNYTTFDVAGGMIFSKPFGFLSAGIDIESTIANAIPLNLYVAVAGYFYRLHTALIGNPIITRMGILPMGHLFNTTMKAIEERQKNPDAGFDMIAHWFKTQREHPAVEFRDIIAHTIISVGGATDTVGIALQSFIYHMIRHPTAYQRVRDEIDAARSEGRCQGSIVQYTDAQGLDYLQACMKETLRVFGPFGAVLPREAGSGGVTIGGHTFAEGTILSVSPWVIHHCRDIWGNDAAKFNPDRWLDEGSVHLEKYLIPFSAGYAACPGQNMAKIEFSKVAATIIRDYDIRLVHNHQKWEWISRIVISIKDRSWPVYVEKRRY